MVRSHPSNVPVTFVETLNVGPPDGSGCDPVTHIPGSVPCSDYFAFPIGSFANVFFFDSQGAQYKLSFDLVPLAGTIFEFVDCSQAGGPPVDPTTFVGQLCGRIRTGEVTANQIIGRMSLTGRDEDELQTGG